MKKVFYVIYSVIDGKINFEELFTADDAQCIRLNDYCNKLQAIYQHIYPGKNVTFGWGVVCKSSLNNLFESCLFAMN